MHSGKGILLKLISAVLFTVMSALIRYLGVDYPTGQVIFFRSAFAILPVVVVYAWRGELMASLRTERPLGQAGRGALAIVAMFFNFGALARLPLIEVERDLLHHAADPRGARRAAAQGARAHLSLVGGHRRLCRRARGARRRTSAATSYASCSPARPASTGVVLALVGCGLERRRGDPDPLAGAEREHVVDRVLLLADLRRRRPWRPGRSDGSMPTRPRNWSRC